MVGVLRPDHTEEIHRIDKRLHINCSTGQVKVEPYGLETSGAHYMCHFSARIGELMLVGITSLQPKKGHRMLSAVWQMQTVFN